MEAVPRGAATIAAAIAIGIVIAIENPETPQLHVEFLLWHGREPAHRETPQGIPGPFGQRLSALHKL
jgi:hypothetical protein